jgi:hypothetical protein
MAIFQTWSPGLDGAAVRLDARLPVHRRDWQGAGTNLLCLANLIGIYIIGAQANLLTGYTDRSCQARRLHGVGAYASAT